MTAISGHTTRAGGTILTAAIYNADHVNHVSNAVALNATKMEGATPPVADGHAVVWDGTSGTLLRTAGFPPANATTVASDQAATTAALATKVAKAGDTMTGLLDISAGAANANAEWFRLKPTDFAANKPYFYIKKLLLPESFEIGTWDGSDNVGTINFGQTILQHLGNDIWDVTSIATQPEAEAGVINTKPMTPLRVAQAIAALVPSHINIGAGTNLFDSTNTWDTGVAGSFGGVFMINTAGAGNTPKVSANGGTNYTNFGTAIASGNSTALCVVKGSAAVAMVFNVNAGAGGAFFMDRMTLTAGSGNVMFQGTGTQDMFGIRVM